jgi:L-alanine-DL-glutamate epimerase-like enolase superfamily enzyme
MAAVGIVRIEALVARAPAPRPVETAFGRMADRPAVLVSLTDREGVTGWGEVWANWPSVGAEHRARLVLADLAPVVFSREWEDAPSLASAMAGASAAKVVQTGEPGPYAQAAAGIDTAMWDLLARRARRPMAAMLSDTPAETVAVYASGIHVNAAAEAIPAARAAGHRAFKVKVGFDPGGDAARLRALLAGLAPGERLMADANMGYAPEEAEAVLGELAGSGLHWFEEPVPPGAPASLWQRLAAVARPMPLAGGENLAGLPQFRRAVALGALGVIQPDVAKWGGVTGCLAAARVAREAGRSYCPHFLGAGIGLAASAHLLAAVGGPGMLEIDANDNPLRDALLPAWPRVVEGRVLLPDGPGLGVLPDLAAIEPFVTFREAVEA